MWVNRLAVNRSIERWSLTEQGKKLWIMKEDMFLTWMGRKMLKTVKLEGLKGNSVLMQKFVVWSWLVCDHRIPISIFFQEIGLALSSMFLKDLSYLDWAADNLSHSCSPNLSVYLAVYDTIPAVSISVNFTLFVLISNCRQINHISLW